MKVAVGNNKMLQQFFKQFIACLVQHLANSVQYRYVYKHKINLSIIYSIIHWYT